MKLIELRVWLKDERKMYYQTENTSSCMDGLERFTQIVGRVTGYTPEVMRYTGLKDKKGVKIYGGDIIKSPKRYEESNYKEDPVRFNYKKEYGVVELKEYPDDERYQTYSHYGWVVESNIYVNSRVWQTTLPDVIEKGEVIGNIYQNKDLLT